MALHFVEVTFMIFYASYQILWYFMPYEDLKKIVILGRVGGLWEKKHQEYI